jgi:hypothetical protein
MVADEQGATVVGYGVGPADLDAEPVVVETS